jgi:hypothetical protein
VHTAAAVQYPQPALVISASRTFVNIAVKELSDYPAQTDIALLPMMG